MDKIIGAYLLDNWIAIVALLISVYVFYKTHLSSFCLAAKTGGRVVISRDPFSMRQKQVSLMLDVIFANDGAKSGIVEDVAVCIQDDSKRFLFRSNGEILNDRINFFKELTPPEMKYFIAFELVKGQSQYKVIFFVPHGEAKEFMFEQKAYQASLWVRSSESEKWRKHQQFAFSVDEDDIKKIDASTFTPQPDGRVFIKWQTSFKDLERKRKFLEELERSIEMF